VSEPKKEIEEVEKHVRLAYRITIVYFTVVFLIALVNWLMGSSSRVNLNELGDFFAGAMSPLAIFWIVMVYRQQRQEMREISKSAKEQVEVMQKQLNSSYRPLLFCFNYNYSPADETKGTCGLTIHNAGGLAMDMRVELMDRVSSGSQDTVFFQRTVERPPEQNKEGRWKLDKVSKTETVYIDKGERLTILIFMEDSSRRPAFTVYFKDTLDEKYTWTGKYGKEMSHREVFDGRPKPAQPILR